MPRRSGLSVTVTPRFLWECLTSRTVSPFPTPASSNAACGCRDRFAARAATGPELGCFGVSAVRARLALTIPTFPQAPLRSRTVGFPESGSDLGSARHLAECGPSHASGSSSAGAHTPLTRIVYPHPRLAPNPHDSRSMPGYGLGNETTECPEPLCPRGALPTSGRLQEPPQKTLLLLHRSYGLMRRTKSLPVPRDVLVHRVFAGCHQSLLGDGRRVDRRNLTTSPPQIRT